MSDTPTQGGIAAALSRLSDRERKLVALTGTVAVLLLVVLIGWSISRSITSREKGIKSRQEEIAQLEALRGEYEAATARQKAASDRITQAQQTSLFTLLQKAAQEVGLSLSDLNERRLPVKDSEFSEITVDVTLKEISIDKLTTLLEKIEGRTQAGVVKVTKLKAKTRMDMPDMLEVSLTVSTWRGASSGGNAPAAPTDGSKG